MLHLRIIRRCVHDAVEKADVMQSISWWPEVSEIMAMSVVKLTFSSYFKHMSSSDGSQ